MRKGGKKKIKKKTGRTARGSGNRMTLDPYEHYKKKKIKKKNKKKKKKKKKNLIFFFFFFGLTLAIGNF